MRRGSESERPLVNAAGYGIGMGGATMAVVAPLLHFALPNVPDVVHFGGTFAIGLATGLIVARLRPVRLGD